MDYLLKKFFEAERWEYAITTGVNKGIDKGILRKISDPDFRIKIYRAIKNGDYKISPPHTAKIPKDTPGEFRTVYVNEGIDRVILSIANDLLMEEFDFMIHKSCTSYQKGIGCGMVVQRLSKEVCKSNQKVVGFKSDLTKYFDSVPIKFIDQVFDFIEEKVGKSALINVIRDYYHSDLYFDEFGNLSEKYQSLKQGCAVASFLADALLYHIDDMLWNLNGYYVRYSDDCCYIGDDYEKAMLILKSELNKMQMTLNPKKVEYLTKDKWFKFLGYSIKGSSISISKGRLKTFQKEIMSRTIKQRNISYERAINNVNRYLYKGNGEFAWARQILSVVNVEHDINLMNAYILDCLRAVQTGKKKIGGLGYVPTNEKGVVVRGVGKNVKANKIKTDKQIVGYYSLGDMRKVLITDKNVYNTLVAQM